MSNGRLVRQLMQRSKWYEKDNSRWGTLLQPATTHRLPVLAGRPLESASKLSSPGETSRPSYYLWLWASSTHPFWWSTWRMAIHRRKTLSGAFQVRALTMLCSVSTSSISNLTGHPNYVIAFCGLQIMINLPCQLTILCYLPPELLFSATFFFEPNLPFVMLWG